MDGAVLVTSQTLAPPAYLTHADTDNVTFVAPDKSWTLTMTREKWRELERPEVFYGMTATI
jgi:hypothetical protein